jgi:hypothetical protein
VSDVAHKDRVYLVLRNVKTAASKLLHVSCWTTSPWRCRMSATVIP